MTDKPILVTVTPRAGNPRRGRLNINCEKGCAVSLTDGSASEIPGGGKQWHWDGNVEAPTVSPSIDCQECGRHFVVTNGRAG